MLERDGGISPFARVCVNHSVTAIREGMPSSRLDFGPPGSVLESFRQERELRPRWRWLSSLVFLQCHRGEATTEMRNCAFERLPQA
jgi:hypothetical protein